MALFGKSSEELTKDAYEKFGLDLDNYNDAKLKEENGKNLKQISQDIQLQGLNKLSINLGFSADKKATVGYLSAIFNTNLILVRQNELIIRALEKLTEKNK
jgi:hypothetical protein